MNNKRLFDQKHMKINCIEEYCESLFMDTKVSFNAEVIKYFDTNLEREL